MDVITAVNLRGLEPSAVWMQKLKASLADFAGPGSPLTAGLLEDNWGGPQTAHPIYSVGLSAISNPDLLAGLEKIFCWRFMAGESSGPIATGCWATPELPGLPAKVIAAVRGPEVADVLASTDQLNHLSIVANQPDNHFDIRVLRIPGICVEAFWLKYTGLTQAGGASDWIVPYGLVISGSNIIKLPGGGTLTKNQAYSANDFLTIAASAARKRLISGQNMPTGRV
jgi:hypothetical protein